MLGLVVFSPLCCHSQGAHFGRFRAFATLSGLELDLLAFAQCTETFRRDVGVMHEKVIAAIVGSDESVTFFSVKPLYCTSSHTNSFGPREGLCY
jgi:hypothetical protein